MNGKIMEFTELTVPGHFFYDARQFIINGEFSGRDGLINGNMGNSHSYGERACLWEWLIPYAR